MVSTSLLDTLLCLPSSRSDSTVGLHCAPQRPRGGQGLAVCVRTKNGPRFQGGPSKNSQDEVQALKQAWSKDATNGAKGIATRSKKLLVAPGIATRSKDATRSIWCQSSLCVSTVVASQEAVLLYFPRRGSWPASIVAESVQFHRLVVPFWGEAHWLNRMILGVKAAIIFSPDDLHLCPSGINLYNEFSCDHNFHGPQSLIMLDIMYPCIYSQSNYMFMFASKYPELTRSNACKYHKKKHP